MSLEHGDIPSGYASKVIKEYEDWLRMKIADNNSSLEPTSSTHSHLPIPNYINDWENKEENSRTQEIVKIKSLVEESITRLFSKSGPNTSIRFDLAGFDGFFVARRVNEGKLLVIEHLEENKERYIYVSYEYIIGESGCCYIKRVGGETESIETGPKAQDICLEFSKQLLEEMNLHYPYQVRKWIKKVMYPNLMEKLKDLGIKPDFNAPPFTVNYTNFIKRYLPPWFATPNKFLITIGEIGDCLVQFRPAGPDNENIEAVFTKLDTGYNITQIQWTMRDNGEASAPHGYLFKDKYSNYHKPYKEWERILSLIKGQEKYERKK